MIYLDNAATTKPVPTLLEAVTPFITEQWYNPSSLYGNGKKVRVEIEKVRNNIASIINAEPEEIYFTSGSSESNNWALQGFYEFERLLSTKHIITTKIEHSSILNLVNSNKFAMSSFINVNENGLVDIKDLYKKTQSYFCKNLVSIIMGNNEIGTIQNIKQLSKIIHRNLNNVFHTDATQCFGHISIDVKDMGIDMLSASAQKIGGIKGTGFLYVKKGIDLEPLIYGDQEQQKRGGTENVIGIIGFGEALKYIDFKKEEQIQNMRDYAIKKLKSNFDCKINGDLTNRLPNNISVTLNYPVDGETLIYMLDMDGYNISSGSACNGHLKEPSHVLKALGYSDSEALRTIRITLDNTTTKQDINNFIETLKQEIDCLESLSKQRTLIKGE